ncbi:MAG TPA: allantoate amidohydrolase [Burkholderiales bacterium]|jgi:allantoate deiminase|nr:allantoate amidohydrolase [Burkholderiales bacterium]
MVSAARIMQRCEALARHSEQPNGLTRVFLSPENRAANELVIGWMREAGMRAKLDAIGNVVGRYEGEKQASLMLGSHLDTVRDAGRYDGMLGVITAIECVATLNAKRQRLPFALEVVGFGDEEGVRFGTTMLGSRAIAGALDPASLDARDANGVSVKEALRQFGLDPARVNEVARRKGDLLAYAELHIEQGPVLEAEGLPVGVVTAINGFSRLRATLNGVAGHAGTVPMHLRRDALAAAAECVLAVERIAKGDPELVGTVGRIEAKPGAINVIPGEVQFTIDIRAPRDELRAQAVREATEAVQAIAARRNVLCRVEKLQELGVAKCAPWLMQQLERAIAAEGIRVRKLPSGAGHDGMAMKTLTDIAMLFVRCKAGISHNPAESITEADAAVGAKTLLRFIEDFELPA